MIKYETGLKIDSDALQGRSMKRRICNTMINILKKPGMHEYNCGCGCTFTFENEDVKYEYFSDDTEDTEYFTINCPYCKRVLGVAFVLDKDDFPKIREMWRNK